MNQLWYWVGGFIIGFHLMQKVYPWVRRLVKILNWMALLPATGAVVVTMAFGSKSCGSGIATVASQPSIPQIRQVVEESRSLGQLVPPPKEFFKKLKEENEKRKKEEEISNVFITTGTTTFTSTTSAMTFATATAGTSGTITMTIPDLKPVGARKGPFCRITCSVHHNDHYDVELGDQTTCDTGRIDKKAETVSGWVRTSDGRFEYLNDWPGPANPGGGFHGYKLYWTNKP